MVAHNDNIVPAQERIDTDKVTAMFPAYLLFNRGVLVYEWAFSILNYLNSALAHYTSILLTVQLNNVTNFVLQKIMFFLSVRGASCFLKIIQIANKK
jgi:hypothetical protein